MAVIYVTYRRVPGDGMFYLPQDAGRSKPEIRRKGAWIAGFLNP